MSYKEFKYEGERQGEKREGQGKLYYPCTKNVFFEGKFVDDDLVHGRLYDVRGNLYYVGHFHEGKFQGLGCIYGPNKVYRHYFNKGKVEYSAGIKYKYN